MFLTRRRRPVAERVFDVWLNINQLDSIPVVNTVMFVRWDVVNDKLAEPATGRTWSRPVEPGNVVRWDESISFTARIPSVPDDSVQLAPFVLRMSIRSERRKKSGFDELGIVEIDLADLAGREKVTRSCLLHKSQLNSLLKIYVKVQLRHGDPFYRRSSHKKDAEVLAGVPPDFSTSSFTSALTTTPTSDISGSATESSSATLAPSVTPSTSYSHNLEQAARGNTSGQFVPSAGAGATPQAQTQGAQSAMLGLSGIAPSRQSIDSSMDHAVHQKTTGPQSLPQWRQTTRDDSIRTQRRSPASALRPAGRARPLSNNSRRDRSARVSSPLSPRLNASEVLDFLVPEPEQDEVYELMRLLRIRPEVPSHILASRVPVETAIDNVMAENAHLWQSDDKSTSALGSEGSDMKVLDLRRLIETVRMSEGAGALTSGPAQGRDFALSERDNVHANPEALSA
jgi:hypothetical protein